MHYKFAHYCFSRPKCVTRAASEVQISSVQDNVSKILSHLRPLANFTQTRVYWPRPVKNRIEGGLRALTEDEKTQSYGSLSGFFAP